MSLILPLFSLSAGCAEAPFTDWDDQSRFLGYRNKLKGRDKTGFRMLPSDKGLHPTDLSSCQIHLGLIMEEKLPPLDSLTQAGLYQKAIVYLFFFLFFQKMGSVFPPFFS